jgi:hypothetical protein
MTHPERLKAIRRVLAPGGKKSPTEVLDAVRVALFERDPNEIPTKWATADASDPPPIPPDGPPSGG